MLITTLRHNVSFFGHCFRRQKRDPIIGASNGHFNSMGACFVKLYFNYWTLQPDRGGSKWPPKARELHLKSSDASTSDY